MKYPLLHPSSYLVLGILSIPLSFLLFFSYLPLKIFVYFMAGLASGIGINEAWFVHLEKNFGAYKKALRTRKGYGKLFRNSFHLAVSYAAAYLLSLSVFFGMGVIPFLAVVSGLGITGLIYYRDAKKFYKRL